MTPAGSSRPALFLVRMDEQTRARWAEVLEGQRRAGAGMAALLAAMGVSQEQAVRWRRFNERQVLRVGALGHLGVGRSAGG